MHRPGKKTIRKVLLLLFLSGGSIGILLGGSLFSLAGGPEKKLSRLKESWNEKDAYRLEERLLSLAQRTSSTPKKGRILLLLGQVRFLKALHAVPLLKHFHFDQAVLAFTESLVNPDCGPDSDFWIGLCRYQSGPEYYGLAVDHLIAALRGGFSDRIKVIKILNYIYLKNRQFDVIIRINEEFLKNRFVDEDVVYSLGRAWREKGLYGKALEVLLRTEGLDPQSSLFPLIRYETAEALFGLADYAGAAGHYRAFLESRQDGSVEEWKPAAELRWVLSLCRSDDPSAKEAVRRLVEKGRTNAEIMRCGRRFKEKHQE